MAKIIFPAYSNGMGFRMKLEGGGVKMAEE